MTESQKHIALYGGVVAVVGIGIAYLMSKRQSVASDPAFLASGNADAIPNTFAFGADFTGQSVGDFGGLGEPVADFGPGPNIVLPPPYVPPSPVTLPKRKRCGCCPGDTMTSPTAISANLAPLLNEMYNSTAIAEWSV